METTLETYERQIREEKCRKKHYPFSCFFSPRLIIGMFILMNPIVSILDVLPDFIGYLLIMSSLEELKKVNDGMADAVFRLKYLVALGVLKFVCSFAVFDFDSSWILTLATAFGALEMFLMILFFNSFFYGMTYLQERHGDSEKIISDSDIKFVSIFFMIVKTVTTVFPQLWALFETRMQTELYDDRALDYIIRMKPYAVIFAIVICLVFGIVWLVKFYKYVKEIKDTKILFDNLREKYTTEVLDRTPVYTNKRVSAALAVISAGHLFLYDFTLERIHIMPEAIAFLLIMIGIFMLSKFINVKRTFAAFVVAFIASVFMYVYRLLYINENIERVEDLTANGIITSSVVFLIFAAALIYFLREMQISLGILSTKFFDESIEQFFFVPNIFLICAIAMSGVCYACPPYRYILVTIRIVTLSIWMYKSINIFNTFSAIIKEDY